MTPRYEGHPLSGAVPGGRSSTTSDLPSSEGARPSASVGGSEPPPSNVVGAAGVAQSGRAPASRGAVHRVEPDQRECAGSSPAPGVSPPPPTYAEVLAALDAAAEAMKPVLLRRLRDAWEGEECPS